MTLVSKASPLKAPQGTHDLLPPDSRRWEQLLVCFAAHARRAGYGFIQTPTFEDLAVFQRMGEGTDVVRKEMYDFKDRSDPPHHLALRPEGTAGVVRAFNQHRPTKANPQAPWKTWYAGPNFRYEAPQKGRFRQFHQLGIECIGTDDPDADVEVIALLWDFYRDIGLKHVTLLINTMGTSEERNAFQPVLQEYLRGRASELHESDREKVESHPMRVLDSKRRESKPVIADAPKMADSLSAQSRERFERVKAGLGALEIPFVLEPKLVRGLDYYTHTTFEFIGDEIGAAQSTIGAGGRYDGLAEDLGGEPTPGIGFATGMERVLLACDAEGVFDTPEAPMEVFIVDVVDGTRARDTAQQLRRAGISAERTFDGRSMRSQMKAADRSGAAFAILIGDDEVEAGEVTVRDLRGAGVQQRVAAGDLVNHLRERLADPDGGGVPDHFYVENRRPAQSPPGTEVPPASAADADTDTRSSSDADDVDADGKAEAGKPDTPGPSDRSTEGDMPEATSGENESATEAKGDDEADEAEDDETADPEAVLHRAKASERLRDIRRALDIDPDG